jgi:osmotically-inducible protein OsmY
MRSHILLFAVAAALTVACERPYQRVNTPAPETLARNVEPAREAMVARESDAQLATAAPARPSVPTPEGLSDAVIGAKIRAALLADPAMAGADVSVSVEHGVVVLTGNVKSYEQAGVASAYAQRQDGVMRVDSQVGLALQ